MDFGLEIVSNRAAGAPRGDRARGGAARVENVPLPHAPEHAACTMAHLPDKALVAALNTAQRDRRPNLAPQPLVRM